MLSYIITKPKDKATISEKAELEEYVNEGDYDPNYYIENQLLPAVIKIIRTRILKRSFIRRKKRTRKLDVSFIKRAKASEDNL